MADLTDEVREPDSADEIEAEQENAPEQKVDGSTDVGADEVEAADYADSHQNAAVKIQSRVRGRQTRARQGGDAGDSAMGANRSYDVGVEEADAANYDDSHKNAAVKIQSRVRGKQTRTRRGGGAGDSAVGADESHNVGVGEVGEADVSHDESASIEEVQAADYDDSHKGAAVKIQSRVRGKQTRARRAGGARDTVGEVVGSTDVGAGVDEVEAADYDDSHENAAVKIQSRVRGKQTRARRGGAGDAALEADGSHDVGVEEADAVDYADSHTNAAVKIQSRVRGRQTRARRAGDGEDAVGEADGSDVVGAGMNGVEAADYDGSHKNTAVKIQSRVSGRQTRARGGI